MKKLFEEYGEALIAIVIASVMFIIVFSFGYPMISKASKETTDKAGSSNWSQRTAIILPSIAASDKPVINAKSAYVDYGQKFNIKNYVTAYDSNGNSLNDNISIYTITCITTDDNGKEKKVTQKATKTTPVSFDTTKPGNYIVKYQVYTRETALSKYLIYSYAKARYVVSNNTHVPTETLDTERFRKYANENSPTKVVFTSSLANAPNTTVDVSVAQNDSIQAWMDGKILYVAQSGGVYASRNCTKLFYSDSSTGWQSKITEIDMTGFVSENITTAYQMFKDCGVLKRIYVSSDWDTDKITTSTGMFENDFNLSGYQGTTFSSSKTNAERAHVDNGASRPGYFSVRQIIVKKTNGSAIYTGTATNGEAKIEVTNPSEGATVRYGTSAGTYNYTAVPSYTAVGTYTVYYKVTAPNFEDATGTLTIVIDKGKGTTVSPKALELNYDGKAHALVSAGKSDAGPLLYSLDNKTWSESIPTGTNTGSYTVYYKVANDTNHLPSDVESVNVEIKKANVTVAEPNTVNVTYNGTAQKLLTGGSVTNGHFEYSLDNGNTWTTTVPTGINAGDYSIDYKAVGNANYSDTIVTTVKSTINPNNIQLNEQSASLSYTGKASNGGAKVTVTYPTTGTTVRYGTTEGIYNLTSVPTYTEVGDHIVYYQVTCANYTTRTGLITITINKAGISFTPPTPIDNLSYNKKDQALINAGTTPNGTMQYSLDQTTLSTTIPTGKNAGNYSVYYRIIGDDSYNDSSIYEIIAKINKISPTITLSPTSGILTYPSTKLSFKATASTNEVSLSASGSGGTGVSASMSGDTVNVVWNKDDYENKFIAGESSVIVSSSTTTNYYSTRVFYSLTTKFGNISASTTNGSATYSGSATNGGAKVTVTAPTSGYTIKYGTKSGEYTSSTIPTYTNAGTYTIYYKISAENYNDKTGSFTIKINKATAKVTTVPTAKTLTYNGNAQALLNAGTTSDGTMQYSTDNSTWSTNIPTGTNAGTYTVYYRVLGDSNHNNSTSVQLSVKINTKAMTVATTNGSATYSGSSTTGNAKVTVSDPSSGYTIKYGTTSGTYNLTSIPGYINAGTYTIYYQVTATNYTTKTGSFTITVNKANASVTKTPTAKTLTYNGSAQALVNAGTASDGTMQYSLNNSTWSTNIPTGTNSGSYTVYYKVVGDSNHNNSSTGNVKVTINTKGMTVSVTNGSATYSGSATSGGAKVTVTDPSSGYTVKYGTASGTYNSTAIPTYTNAGTYTVYYQVTATNYTTKTGSLTISIAKAGSSVTKAPTAKTLTYNGSAQALVNAGTASGGTMQYSLNNSTWSANIPTGTNAGTYTVYYRAAGDSNHNNSSTGNVKVTISTKAMTVSSTNGSATYSGSATNGGAKVTVTTPSSGYTVKYGTANGTYNSTTIPTYTNAGTYTIYYQVVATNYTTKAGSFTITISKANASVSKAPTAKTLTYNGNAQALVNAGTASGGTMQYSLNNSTWTTSIPTGTNAGNYTVYYRVVGDSNHNSTSTANVTAKINTKAMTVSVTNGSATYSGSATTGGAKVTVTDPSSGYTVKYGTANGTYNSTAIPTYTNAGTYTVYYQVTATNYTTKTGSLTISIATKAMAVSTTNGSATYSGSATNGGAKVTVTTPSSGYTIKYGTTSGSYTLTSMPTYTNAGTYTIYYQITATNYTTKTGSLTITIAKANANVTKAPTAKALTYTGSAQALVNAGTASGGTMQYSLNNSTWTTSIPTGTNAGNYTVYYRVLGDNNHNNSSVGSVKVTIISKTYTLCNGANFYSLIPSTATSVEFTSAVAPNGVTLTDVTEAQDNSVVAWTDGTTWKVSTQESGKKVIFNEESIGMFSGKNALTKILFNNIDTSNVTNMNYMFEYCESLTSLDLSNFNTKNTLCMYSMFKDCSSLETLKISNFDTSNVTSMHYMFYYCSKLTNLDVSNFDTSNVTSMHCMFGSCHNLTSIDVSHFDTSKVTDMYGMFSYCSNVKILNTSNFNTNKVTDMEGMFSGCSSLTSLDVSHFNTSRVTSIYGMFQDCSNLTSLNVTNFDTSNCEWGNMSSMFENCSKLTVLDLSNFDTSLITQMDNMFNGCSNLKTIYVSDLWTVSRISNSGNAIFNNCPKIVGQSGVTYDSSKIDATMANFQTGYLTYKGNNIFLDYCDRSEIKKSSTITKGSQLPTPTRDGYIFNGWYYNLNKVQKFENTKISNFTNPNSDYSWTKDSNNIWSSGNKETDSSESKMISEQFTLSQSGTVSFEWRSNGENNYDYLGYDILNVSTGKYLSGQSSPTYKNCLENLKGNASTSFSTITQKLEVGTYQLVFMYGKDSSADSNEDQGFVKNVQYGITSTSYEYSNPVGSSDNIAKGTYVYAKWIDTNYLLVTGSEFNSLIPNNATKIEFTSETAPSETSLTDVTVAKDKSVVAWLDGTTWKVSTQESGKKIIFNESCSQMFDDKENLKNILFTNIDTSDVTNMSGMFNYCSGLTILDVSNFNTNNVTTMSEMFGGCSNLTSLNVSSFDTSNVTTMSGMFNNCQKLNTLNLSSFSTNKVTYVNNMFRTCVKLQTIYVSNLWNITNITNSDDMFYGCFLIVGQSGTTYDSSKENVSMANYQNGYLTLMQTISKTESQVGKYADINGDGTVDGIIFADLMVGGSGQWYDVTGEDAGKYTIPTISSCKDYYVSQESYTNKLGGTAEVLSPTGSGNSRFYITALNDIDSDYHDWYNAASEKMTDYANTTSLSFGKGKSNTATMISKWNSKSYGEQNACSDHTDLWGNIQAQVNNGWFVPSIKEWAAFAKNIGITDSNYSSKGLKYYYWSSSQYKAHAAYSIGFGQDCVGADGVEGYANVRLATTF